MDFWGKIVKIVKIAYEVLDKGNQNEVSWDFILIERRSNQSMSKFINFLRVFFSCLLQVGPYWFNGGKLAEF